MQGEEDASRPRARELESDAGRRRARVASRRPTGRRTAKQLTGMAAEDIAAGFLHAQGLEVLQRNYLRRVGELDIVARDPKGVLVIAEVRCRAGDRFGGAAASVGFRKQQRLIRAASQFLQRRPGLARMPVRFDVLCVSDMSSGNPHVEWIRQAFLT